MEVQGASGPPCVVEYLVDGFNRRIARTATDCVDLQSRPERQYLYQDELHVVAELDGMGAVVSRFVYGGRENVPEYMVQGTTTYRLLTDHLGSVRMVVDVATGNVAQRLDYDEFGRVVADSSPGFQPFGFAGGLYDWNTGLTRFGARDYLAETGQWTARDPILFAGGDANLYGYVLNDPVNLSDPYGTNPLFAAMAWSGIKGAAFELGTQLLFNGGKLSCVDWGAVAWEGVTSAVNPLGRATKALRKVVEKLPRLKRLHPDSSLRQSSLDYWRRQHTDDIVRSLKPDNGRYDPLLVKPDGTIMQGNTRTKILEERGYDIASLEWTLYD